MWPLLLVGLLAPVASPAATEAPELGIVGAFLAETDSPLVMGDHCRRHGGVQTTEDLPALDAPWPVWTNGHLYEHVSWHFRHLSIERAVFSLGPEDRYGDEFVAFHREMIAHYDAWREAYGHEPVATWDPALPIPPEFAYPASAGCRARDHDDVNLPAPTWATIAGGEKRDPLWNHTALCQFADVNELGKSIDWGYHGDVHAAVGGDMDNALVSPRDPVFWAWHKFLDVEIFQTYERECIGEPATLASASAPLEGSARAVPGPTPFMLVLGLAGALVLRGRRT